MAVETCAGPTDGADVVRRGHRRGGTDPHRTGALATTLPGVALSGGLVVWHFSDKPLWRDEWFTYSTVERPLGSMLRLLSETDGGLAGFYLVMHAWMLVGDSVAWLRLPAAVCTVALSAAVALLGRRVGGTAAGAVAGLVVALLPAVVEHEQEARAYPLVLLATTAAGLAALRYREGPTRGRWVVLASLGAAAAALHPLPGAPAVAGIFSGMLLAPGAARRSAVVLAGLPAGALAGALVAVGLAQQGVSDAASPGGVGTVLLLRYVLTHSWSLLAVLVVLALAGAASLLGRRRDELTVLVAWVVVPLAVMSVLTVIGSFFKPRYVSTTVPVVAVLVGVGVVVSATALARPVGRFVGGAWTPVVRIAGVSLLVAMLLVALAPRAVGWLSAPYRTDDPRSAARTMAAGWNDGDQVVYVGATARGLVTFYAPAGQTFDDPLLRSSPRRSDTVAGVEVAPGQRRPAVADAGRLWVIGQASANRWSEPAEVADVTAGRVRAEHREFGNYWLERWDAR